MFWITPLIRRANWEDYKVIIHDKQSPVLVKDGGDIKKKWENHPIVTISKNGVDGSK